MVHAGCRTGHGHCAYGGRGLLYMLHVVPPTASRTRRTNRRTYKRLLFYPAGSSVLRPWHALQEDRSTHRLKKERGDNGQSGKLSQQPARCFVARAACARLRAPGARDSRSLAAAMDRAASDSGTGAGGGGGDGDPMAPQASAPAAVRGKLTAASTACRRTHKSGFVPPPLVPTQATLARAPQPRRPRPVRPHPRPCPRPAAR